MTGIFVACYIAIGALAAILLYFAVDHGIQHREDDPKLNAAMDELERPLRVIPGGMALFLAATVVLWPLMLATLLRDFLRSRRSHG